MAAAAGATSIAAGAAAVAAGSDSGDSSDTCSICMDKFTKMVRKPLACPHCQFAACMTCIKTYLTSGINYKCDCMSCHAQWGQEFIDDNLTKRWRLGPLREHRTKSLLEREMALLPERQQWTELAKADTAQDADTGYRAALSARAAAYSFGKTDIIALEVKLDAALAFLENPTIGDTNAMIDACKSIAGLANPLKSYMQEVQRTVPKWADLDTILSNFDAWMQDKRRPGIPELAKSARVFVKPCPVTDCTGFLSTAWKCGLCETWTCSKCEEVIGETKTAPHDCNADTLASIATKRATTKPCPKCGTAIEKSSGCSQVRCTNPDCLCLFEFNTLEISRDHDHTPYRVYVAKLLGTEPAAPGFLVAAPAACDVLRACDHWQYRNMTFVDEHGKPIKAGNYNATLEAFCAMTDFVQHLQHRELRELRDSLPKDVDYIRLSVMYQLGKLSKEQWGAQLWRLENDAIKTHRKLAMLDVLAEACKDILVHPSRCYFEAGDVYKRHAPLQWKMFADAVDHVTRLLVINNTLADALSKVYGTKFPCVSYYHNGSYLHLTIQSHDTARGVRDNFRRITEACTYEKVKGEAP